MYLRFPAQVRLAEPIRVHSLQICHYLALENTHTHTHKYIHSYHRYQTENTLISTDSEVQDMRKTNQIFLLVE